MKTGWSKEQVLTLAEHIGAVTRLHLHPERAKVPDSQRTCLGAQYRRWG